MIENSDPYRVWTIAGSGDQGSQDHRDPLQASFNSPSGVAFSRDGVLAIADTGSHTIRYMLPGFNFVNTLVGIPGVQGNLDDNMENALLDRPVGLVFIQGNLYFSQPSRHNIRVVST